MELDRFFFYGKERDLVGFKGCGCMCIRDLAKTEQLGFVTTVVAQ